jgi:predicted enzyme related to lactoylglutathione lyase
MPDGSTPAPGGWNRFQLEVDDLDRRVAELQDTGIAVRGGIIDGKGGRQAIVDDPSGNPVELFEPHR